jgi:hypothetical protein
MFADLLLGRLRLVDPDEADADDALAERQMMGTTCNRSGSRLRTSIQTRVNFLVLVCSASPPTGNPSANRSVPL